MSNKSLDLARYYSRHLPAFAFDLLKIRLEAGGIARFDFNQTQWQLHQMLEQQLGNHGKVRAIVLKPRRDGLSTYIAARYFHKVLFGDGLKTLIVSHTAESTKVLFDMVKLYLDRLLPEFAPKTDNSSANSLTFSQSSGAYSVATAGNPEATRGSLSHLFHGSEVAYWRKAEDVVTASLETIGDCAGTEIVLESTGAPNTYFQELWDRAVEGKGVFMPIFFAWYKSNRNRADSDGLILRDDERELLKIYPGMDLANIAFRRNKLATMSEAKFNREYPSTPAHAFMQDTADAFISPELVEMASKRTHKHNARATRILGVDPSQTSDGDECGMCIRQGNRVLKLALFTRDTVQERADVVRRFFDVNQCDHLFIDQGGSGKEIFELLIQWGMSRSVMTLVPFGAKASDSKAYPNKRVEMYSLARNWLEEEGGIPNDIRFKSELSLTKRKINNNGQEVLESKKDMRKSPNLADSFALTFAYPVSANRRPQTTEY